jgi:nucleoid DNA-binding protein
MRKQELARRLARRSGVSPAEAADELDRVVHGILRGLRKGESVPFPGLGKFKPGPKGELEFEADAKKGGGGRG